MAVKPSQLQPFWQGMYIVNSVHAVIVGLYARRRHKFRRDFTYNKFHFGVFIQIGSALGIAAASKFGNPLIPGLLFLSTIGLTSFPAYLEGFKEVRNEPDLVIDEHGTMRRVGIYCFVLGWGLVYVKRRGSIPFLLPKLKNLL